MTTQIEITNNPYEQQFQILINGKTVPAYSSLRKYISMPFTDACEKLLEVIHQECNYGKYRLLFRGREEEQEIMEVLCRNDAYCEEFCLEGLVQNAPLNKRMAELSKIYRNIYSDAAPVQNNRIVYVMMRSDKELEVLFEELEVQNIYCQTNIQILSFQEYKKKSPDSDICFFIGSEDADFDKIKALGYQKGYYLKLAGNSQFLGKTGGIFCYETLAEEITSVIFKCLLLDSLVQVFRSAIEQLPEEMKKRYQSELRSLVSISPNLTVHTDSRIIELGKSIPIAFGSEIKGYCPKIQDLEFDYGMPGIISCDGFRVKGEKCGKTELLVFRRGETTPCLSIQFQVIVRNRIEAIRFEADYLLLGEGDKVQMGYDYIPPDADNVNTMVWQSDDESVAEVNSYGVITAKNAGNCTLSCTAENVKARCECTVKPYLREIYSEIESLCLSYGQSVEIPYCMEPLDCIDGEIEIVSKDFSIVNTLGNVARGVGIGKTIIVIQNRTKTVQREIQVEVLNERQWKKYEKRKNSIFRKLF